MGKSMSQAIRILENKRTEWLARAEYHRTKAMEYHTLAEYMKRDEEQQLEESAIDNIHGLNYAIEVLKNSQEGARKE